MSIGVQVWGWYNILNMPLSVGGGQVAVLKLAHHEVDIVNENYLIMAVHESNIDDIIVSPWGQVVREGGA